MAFDVDAIGLVGPSLHRFPVSQVCTQTQKNGHSGDRNIDTLQLYDFEMAVVAILIDQSCNINHLLVTPNACQLKLTCTVNIEESPGFLARTDDVDAVDEAIHAALETRFVVEPYRCICSKQIVTALPLHFGDTPAHQTAYTHYISCGVALCRQLLFSSGLIIRNVSRVQFRASS